MAFALDWHVASGWFGCARESGRRPEATPLSDVVAKHDERLLRDIGLTRRDALGVEGLALEMLKKQHAIWRL